MPEKKLTLFDCDGNLTDDSIGDIPFTEGYIFDMAQHLNLPLAELKRIWGQVEKEILAASPDEVGWIDVHGRIIAPIADGMILARAVGEKILRLLLADPAQLQIETSNSLTKTLPQDNNAKNNLLFKFFRENYHKREFHLREGMIDLLRQISESSDVAVITNSATADVRGNLERLGLKIPVFGDAKKYEIGDNDDPYEMPDTLSFTPHLKRLVYIQRQKYFQALRKAGWHKGRRTVVSGDIWELDLMLALLLNMRAVLMEKVMTPKHEKAIVGDYAKQGMARIVKSAGELYGAISEFHQA